MLKILDDQERKTLRRIVAWNSSCGNSVLEAVLLSERAEFLGHKIGLRCGFPMAWMLIDSDIEVVS